MILLEAVIDTVDKMNQVVTDIQSDLSDQDISLEITVLDSSQVGDENTIQFSFIAIPGADQELSEIRPIVMDVIRNSQLPDYIDISQMTLNDDDYNGQLVGEVFGPSFDNEFSSDDEEVIEDEFSDEIDSDTPEEFDRSEVIEDEEVTEESVKLDGDSLEESFSPNEVLNPKLFDEDGKLKPSVRSKVQEIVREFLDYIDFPLVVVDTYLVGSNVNYNYHGGSDLDVHVITNFDTYNLSDEILQTIFNSKKSSFNDNYDITIKDIPVELYIEDMNTSAVSNGVYSINSDDWIKVPVKDEVIDICDECIDDAVNYWKLRLQTALNENCPIAIQDVVDRLYLLRKESLLTEGEYGEGNLVFKEMRSQGLIKSAIDKIFELKSQELSLESMKIGDDRIDK